MEVRMQLLLFWFFLVSASYFGCELKKIIIKIENDTAMAYTNCLDHTKGAAYLNVDSGCCDDLNLVLVEL